MASKTDLWIVDFNICWLFCFFFKMWDVYFPRHNNLIFETQISDIRTLDIDIQGMEIWYSRYGPHWKCHPVLFTVAGVLTKYELALRITELQKNMALGWLPPECSKNDSLRAPTSDTSIVPDASPCLKVFTSGLFISWECWGQQNCEWAVSHV